MKLLKGLYNHKYSSFYHIGIDVFTGSANSRLFDKSHTISIIIPGRSEAIGNVKYTVIEVPITTETPLTPIDIIISYGGFVFFIFVSVGAVGALYLANKKFKWVEERKNYVISV